MSSQSYIMAEAATAPRATPPLSPTRPFYWSVRRELWEFRSIVVGPLVAAGVVLFGFLMGTVGLRNHLGDLSNLEPAKRAAILAIPYGFAAMAIMVTGLIVAVFYCLGALHNERRDRSILFWKSLPVSDLVTVLAKAFVPLVVLPLVVLAVIAATQLIMLLTSTLALLAAGQDASAPWTQIPWPRLYLILPYGLAALALWYAPVFGWLMLVSGWAKRAPFLWAVLPPLALCLVEKIAFDTTNFASLLGYRLNGVFGEAFALPERHWAGGDPVSGSLPRIDPAGLLSTPGLWAGLVFAAACLAAAIWQRRYREPV